MCFDAKLYLEKDKCNAGTCKMRNEIETKRNETKRNKSKRNEIYRNETKSKRFGQFRFVSVNFVSIYSVSFRFAFVSHFTGTHFWEQDER